jgi:hypothetical protein
MKVGGDMHLTYGGYKCCVECIIRESEQQTGFTNARITNKQQFKQ